MEAIAMLILILMTIGPTIGAILFWFSDEIFSFFK